MTAAEREQASAVERVFEFMRRHSLTLADLIEVGGEDLKSPNPKRVEKARRVERCWSLIARLGLTYAALETAAPALPPAKQSRRARGEGGFLQPTENTRVLGSRGADDKANEINALADSGPVGPSEMKSPDGAGAALGVADHA